MSLINISIILAGLGVFFIIFGMFEIKKYNYKFLITIASLILVISLTLSYFQMSSPSYYGNKLFNFGYGIVLILSIFIGVYDYTHDYKLPNILALQNLSSSTKNILTILVLIAGIIVGLFISIYIYKI